jgi:hypothetical protein
MKNLNTKTKINKFLNVSIFIALLILLFSCSKPENGDCLVEKQKIIKYYAVQIQYVNDHPGPDGVDYRQIALLQQERDRKIYEACN